MLGLLIEFITKLGKLKEMTRMYLTDQSLDSLIYLTTLTNTWQSVASW